MSSTPNTESVIKSASIASKIVEAVAPIISESLLEEIEKDHKAQRQTTQKQQNWSSK
jgi:hypothetical protein